MTDTINNNGADAALLQGILDGTANTTHTNGVRYGNNFQEFTSQGLQLELGGAFETASVSHDLTFGVRRHDDETRNVATEGNVIYQQVNGSLFYEAGNTGGSFRHLCRLRFARELLSRCQKRASATGVWPEGTGRQTGT